MYYLGHKLYEPEKILMLVNCVKSRDWDDLYAHTRCLKEQELFKDIVK